jgi:hypothetical protein
MNLHDAEQLKTFVVDPMVKALKEELQAQLAPLTKQLSDHETRVQSLEGDRRKALIGFGGMSLVVSAALTSGWEWVRSKIHVG